MFKAILTAAALAGATLAPSLAVAQESCDHQAAASCAEGLIWDAETKTCVATTS